MTILSIWDGHDSSAVIIKDNKILFANNEEKYTNRKLEVQFPENAIKTALKYTGLTTSEIDEITFSTSNFSMLLNRMFPRLKESYYRTKRKLTDPPHFLEQKRLVKYLITLSKSNSLLKRINTFYFKKKLLSMGFKNQKIYCYDHSLSHIGGALFTSPFDKALVISLDGIGDGLAGRIVGFKDNKLYLLSKIPGRDSLGIFYEQATVIANFRELEDEGKLMALSDYYTPRDSEKNPLMDFFYMDKHSLKARYNPIKQYLLLKKIYWKNSRERFAFMVQKTFEHYLLEFIRNNFLYYNKVYHFDNLILTGGIFSNVKANMILYNSVPFKGYYVYPNMGDGGLALGAGLIHNFLKHNIVRYQNTYYDTFKRRNVLRRENKREKDLQRNFFYNFLGDNVSTSNEEVIEYLNKLREENKIKFKIIDKDKLPKEIATLLKRGFIIALATGRTEFGPRALGHRSIICRPDSLELKNKLNLKVKFRDYFQPFAPAILKEKAGEYFVNVKQPDYYMTTAFKVKKKKIKDLKGCMNVDFTVRPQFVTNLNGLFYNIIKEFYAITGIPAILNTSFNLHGYPIVNNYSKAVEVFLKTGIDYLIINNILITKIFVYNGERQR